MHAERETAALGACALTDHSEGTDKAARHLTSHKRRDDNQAGDGASPTDQPSLTDPESARTFSRAECCD